MTPGVLGFIVFAVMPWPCGPDEVHEPPHGRVDFDEAPDGAGEASGKGAAEQTSGKASPAKG
ncbi:hypothetical protein [Streptomyces sp. F001]|uniref:hypothetical protein n=1 Tax=Streptomyces sp. F001 TaxID=1510026 RepID=UPI001F0E0C45|nr:hypothetical protein [Streptomyces sp. F001]